MADSQTPTRRSQRKRQPNQKYSIDAFEGIEELAVSGTEDEVPINDDSDEDADFRVDLEPGASAEAEEEDELSADGGSIANVSNEQDEFEEEDLDDGASIVSAETSIPRDTKNGRTRQRPPRKLTARTKVNEREGVLYVRGLEDYQRSVAKGTRMQYTFGPDPDDIMPYILARDKWNDDTTLPSRCASHTGSGGMHKSFFYSPEMQTREIDEGWRWYYEQDGARRIQAKQRLSRLSLEEARPYLHPESVAQPFFIGPQSQTIQSLEWGESLDLSKPWQCTNSSASTNGAPSSDIPKRRGWIMNVGSQKVQYLDWMPNAQGDTQYLAVAMDQAGSYANQKPYEASIAPAFDPRASTPASLQIWSFGAKQISEEGSWSIDANRDPKLTILLCTDWGDIRVFKWCPMIDRERHEDPQSSIKRLGLLAGIWADGLLRVIDVFHTDSEKDTEYVHINSAAFEARPPNDVFTNLEWLSTFDIAASTAQGFVAIFNIATGTQSSHPRPWFYKPLADTYIFNLVSGYPSRPQILFTTSMSGFIRLTDLRSPHSDSTESLRSRIGSPVIAWHEQSQCLVSCDDAPNLRLLPLRRFFASMIVTKLSAPASSSQCLATSPVHPSVLVGLADGSVAAVNPLRRVQGPKLPLFTQKWFQHEFSQATPRARELGGDAGGVVRFSEGFKVESAGSHHHKEEMERRRKDGETGFNPLTVYEEKSAVTALAWNPNLHCGGWAAAGMGSGLLRVEDIALDRN
ncbi:MAG: hypothetical protein M1821_009225 [Bathelium mastoideum]|nr:MAG: hypothetical protein M1821_009225 [Bathelium mastoideum]